MAEELIGFFGLSDAMHRTVMNYSGGMKRRLDIAASLITQPEVLFLDEPTTGLDPQSRTQVWEVVRSLLKLGTTVLLTTQYLEEADRLADRIAVMDKGAIVAEGTPLQLKASIGKKTLSVRLRDQQHKPKVEKLLTDRHGLMLLPGEDTLHMRMPVNEAIAANQAVQTLLSNDCSIDSFSLDEPSLDEVFLALTSSVRKEAAEQ